MERRVVITGIGALTPIGNNTAEFWDGLKNGKNGSAHISNFDIELFRFPASSQRVRQLCRRLLACRDSNRRAIPRT